MFKKLDASTYPPRHWSLIGPPGAGKSTFATRLRGPLLLVDADHRFAEVAALAGGDVFTVSDNPADHSDPERIAACLKAGMAGARIGTIVVDSLTAILSPLVATAVLANDAGQYKNKMQAWRPKAMAMRVLQDAVTAYGTDTLWIYHERPAMTAQAEAVTAPSIPRTELARLQRSLNLRLKMLTDGTRRGIEVQWARRGRAGLALWDESGDWAGMPERIEAAVYGGLSQAEQDAIERATPASFPSADAAIAWGLESGAFDALQHARAAYDKLKADAKPATAGAMWQLWIADVRRRQAEQDQDQDHDTDRRDHNAV